MIFYFLAVPFSYWLSSISIRMSAADTGIRSNQHAHLLNTATGCQPIISNPASPKKSCSLRCRKHCVLIYRTLLPRTTCGLSWDIIDSMRTPAVTATHDQDDETV
ncbi:hypothetical protein M432DRAFT_608880 [Thermoascus aurantiacus ATCC 26904]